VFPNAESPSQGRALNALMRAVAALGITFSTHSRTKRGRAFRRIEKYIHKKGMPA
jgi:hypothetical protein